MSVSKIGVSNLFFGPPGSGKTLTCVYTALCMVEIYQKELNDKMIVIESKHKDYNFNKLKISVLNSFLNYYEKLLLEEKKSLFKDKKKLIRFVNNQLHIKRKSIWIQSGIRTHRKEFKRAKEIDFYQVMNCHYYDLKYQDFEQFEIDYIFYFFSCYLDNMIYSNFPIYDKRTGIMSCIISYKWFAYKIAKDKSAAKLIMPYKIYIIDEADKEFPSFVRSSKNDKGEDDTSATSTLASGFSEVMKMFRHLTHNKGLMLFSCQIPTSLHFQIRGNCETFIEFTKHKKDSMPTIITKLEYLLIKLFVRMSNNLYIGYSKRRMLNKDTATGINLQIKKKNIGFWSIAFLNIFTVFNNLKERFRKEYLIFLLYAKVYDNVELTKGSTKNLKINYKDVAGAYDSTFFFRKHIGEVLRSDKKSLAREFWKQLSPTAKQLVHVESNFYNYYFNLVKKEEKKKEKRKREEIKILKKEDVKKIKKEEQKKDISTTTTFF